MFCRRTRSQSCPFCRDSLKRVNSGDLWVFTDGRDVVDMATVTRENLRRLFMYIDKLPLIIPDSLFDTYDSHLRWVILLTVWCWRGSSFQFSNINSECHSVNLVYRVAVLLPTSLRKSFQPWVYCGLVVKWRWVCCSFVFVYPVQIELLVQKRSVSIFCVSEEYIFHGSHLKCLCSFEWSKMSIYNVFQFSSLEVYQHIL